MMETYRNFIPMTVSFAPVLTSAIVESRIEEFAKNNGIKRNELSTNQTDVYELDFSHYRRVALYLDEANAAITGIDHLPEIMLIGLVSSYDAFLADLLRVTLKLHEEIVLTSEKMIRFSELSKFSSIEEAREHLIEREIEGVIRTSHHEQFTWMERSFSMQLRKDLEVWPDFIEACERRNLMTHTGGVVSGQYLRNCAEHNATTKGVKIGDKLFVSSSYFANSVRAISEIGMKLCYVLWRKFQRDERAKADVIFSETCFDLIFKRAYKLSEELLKFGVSTLAKGGNERTRRMMVINLANSVRLQDRKDEAVKIIEKEDWSATSVDFRICATAVKGDVKGTAALMREVGRAGPIQAEDYRLWPVFRGLRTQEEFLQAFTDVFDEPLFRGTALPGLEEPSEAEGSESGLLH